MVWSLPSKWPVTTTTMTSGGFQAATPSSQPPHRGNLSVNVAAPSTCYQPAAQAGSSTTPLSTSMQTPQGADQSKVDAYLRVLNPANKKDFRPFTIRNLSHDEMNSPDKLKMAVFTQCGDDTACASKHGIRILESFWEEAVDKQQIGSE